MPRHAFPFLRLGRVVALSLVVALPLLGHMPARAVTLTQAVSPAPFADTSLGGTSLAERPELAGTVLEDLITPFSFSGIVGTVQSRVVKETITGTLDFYWTISVDSTSTGSGVVALRLVDLGYDFLTDTDWRTDGLGTVGVSLARLFNPSNYPTGAVNFLLDGAVNAGASSAFFFLHTNATSYAQTAQFDLLGGSVQVASGTYSTFAPAVPEPSSLALSLLGLSVAGLVLRRRPA